MDLYNLFRTNERRVRHWLTEYKYVFHGEASKLVDVESFQQYLTPLSTLDLCNAVTYQWRWPNNSCGTLGTYHSSSIGITLAPGCAIIGTVAGGSMAVLDLSPSTIPALNLFKRITVSKAGLILQLGRIHIPHQSCRSRRNAYLRSRPCKDCSYAFGHRHSQIRRCRESGTRLEELWTH